MSICPNVGKYTIDGASGYAFPPFSRSHLHHLPSTPPGIDSKSVRCVRNSPDIALDLHQKNGWKKASSPPKKYTP